jgi:hypothetical protein
MSGYALSLRPDPFADLGVTGGTGGGEGDFLGAVSVLDIVFVFGITPEVDAVGDDWVVLGLDELAKVVDEEGRAALAEVLDFGGLIVVGDAGGGAGVPVAGLGPGALTRMGCSGCGCSEK